MSAAVGPSRVAATGHRPRARGSLTQPPEWRASAQATLRAGGRSSPGPWAGQCHSHAASAARSGKLRCQWQHAVRLCPAGARRQLETCQWTRSCSTSSPRALGWIPDQHANGPAAVLRATTPYATAAFCWSHTQAGAYQRPHSLERGQGGLSKRGSESTGLASAQGANGGSDRSAAKQPCAHPLRSNGGNRDDRRSTQQAAHERRAAATNAPSSKERSVRAPTLPRQQRREKQEDEARIARQRVPWLMRAPLCRRSTALRAGVSGVMSKLEWPPRAAQVLPQCKL